MQATLNSREDLIQHFKTIYTNYNVDLEEVENTSLWELEERIGADHFRISKPRGKRIGYQPLQQFSKDEIIKLDQSVI